MEVKNEQIIKSTQLAEILGISERHLRRLASENVIVKNGQGKYLLVDSVKNYIEYLESKNDVDDDLKNKKVKEEIEYLRTRDKKEKIKIKILEGDLHEGDDVKKVMNNVVAGFKGQLKALPYKLAPLVIGIDNLGELQEIILDNINLALSELSKYDKSKFLKNKEYIKSDDADEEA